jgi:hypothetical protein
MTGRKQGPEPDRLKNDRKWDDAMAHAMRKPRPDSGWPKPGDEPEESNGEREEDRD